MRTGPVIAIAIVVPAAGCSLVLGHPRATDPDFRSANSAARLAAIEHAIEAGDPASVPDLIEQLDDDDPLVRWMAINALARITGETRGFDYWADPLVREEAIREWEATQRQRTEADAAATEASGAADG